jgi:hypothetical protein
MTHHVVHMYDAEMEGCFMKSNHRMVRIIHSFMTQLVTYYTDPLSCYNGGDHAQYQGSVMYESHTMIDGSDR